MKKHLVTGAAMEHRKTEVPQFCSAELLENGAWPVMSLIKGDRITDMLRIPQGNNL